MRWIQYLPVYKIMCGCTADPYYQYSYPVSEIGCFFRHAQAVAYNSAVDFLNRYQSAYRSMHSIETALLKVQIDLLRNLDDGKI